MELRKFQKVTKKDFDKLSFPCYCTWSSLSDRGKRFSGQINRGYSGKFYYQLCDLTPISYTIQQGNVMDQDYSLEKLIKNYNIFILL